MGVKRDIKWVSSCFKPYREECDDDKAWLLYEWNAKVASELTECIHHVEVLFRNSIIEQLEKIHPLAYPWHLDNKTIKDVAAKQSPHHDSLLRFDPSVELKKIIKLASWIDSHAAQWIERDRTSDGRRSGAPGASEADTAIIGHRNDEVYTIYKKVGALVNSARSNRPVTYIGFYHDKRIEAEFPTILEIEVPKTWSAKEAARLKKSSDAKEKRLGKVMSCTSIVASRRKLRGLPPEPD